MRLSFNYRNGVSVFRFDCHTYYSRCAHPSSSSSLPSSTVFFSSLFSRDHGAVSQISFSRLSKFRGFTGYNHDHPGLFFVTFSSFHATNRSPIYYNKVYCYLCVTTEWDAFSVYLKYRRKKKREITRDSNFHWHNDLTLCRPQLHGINRITIIHSPLVNYMYQADIATLAATIE